MLERPPEPPAGHVPVDRLELAGTDPIGLVPDPDVARVAHPLVELLPRRQVRIVGVAGEVGQVLEAAPVLDVGERAAHEREPRVDHALLRVRLELADHRRHRDEHRPPLARPPEAVDPHPDQKEDELILDPSGVSAGLDPSHRPTLRLAEPDPAVQAAQRRRRPPVPFAEQPHQRGDQQRPDDRRVDQHGDRRPDPELLDEDDLGGGEGPDRDREQDRRGGHDPAGALEPDRDGLAIVVASVARLLDSRQQEDAVVGREPEDDREQQQRLGRLEPALARVAEQVLEPPVLEDQHQDPEGGAEPERVHQHLLQRQDHRAGHQEEDDEGDHDDDRQHLRQVVAEARLQVEEVGGEAGHGDGRVELAQALDQILALLAQRRGARDRLDRVDRAFEPPRRVDRVDPLDPLGLGSDPLGLGVRDPVELEHDRLVVEGREVGTQRVVDLAGAGRAGQHLGVDGGELDREERDPERDQQRRARRGDPAREPHHQLAQPVPEPLRGGLGVAIGAAVEEGGGERVDPLAEQREHRRQHDQRDRGGDQRDQRPADPHRVEEALREDEQRGERPGDGQGAEQDRPPGGLHRPPHRRQPRSRAGDLLAVARDHEQAVVDRQAEPEAGDQVEGEDRDRAHLAGDAQHQECADDRQPADQQRQQRGDQAAEEEQREQEEEREGEQLGLAQVGLDLLVDLGLGDRRAADADPGLVLERGGDPLGDVLGLVVVGRLEPDREVGRVAVAGDERPRAGLGEAGDRGDARIAGDPAFDLLDSPGPGGRGRVGVRDQHDHLGRPVARVLEPLVGDHALGRGILGAVGIEPVGDPGAEGACEDEEQGGDQDHATAAAVGESGETVDHLSSFASFSHQSAMKSLKAIPNRRVAAGPGRMS